MGPTHTFRTVFARVLTIAAAAVIIIVLVYSLIDGGLAAAWQALPFLVVGGGLTWVVFGHPKVEVSDGGVTVVNILRQVHVPWPTLRGVESRWALSIETDDGTVSSWAIPASSGMGMRLRPGSRKVGNRPAGEPGVVETGHDAAAVALVIAERLETLTQRGYLDSGPTHGEVRTSTRWNHREVAVIAFAAVVVLAMVLTS